MSISFDDNAILGWFHAILLAGSPPLHAVFEVPFTSDRLVSGYCRKCSERRRSACQNQKHVHVPSHEYRIRFLCSRGDVLAGLVTARRSMVLWSSPDSAPHVLSAQSLQQLIMEHHARPLAGF